MIDLQEIEQDEKAVREAQGGNTLAFERLVELHFGKIYAVAYANLGHREAAEDLTQEAFLRAYLHLSKLRHARVFQAWVARIARNLASTWKRDGLRASRVLTLLPIEEADMELPDERTPSPREQADMRRKTEKLEEAVRGLEPALREVVLLHYVEGLNQSSIARLLGINKSSVCRQLTKAITQLREKLVIDLPKSAPALRYSDRAAKAATAAIAVTAALPAISRAALTAATSDTVLPGGGAFVAARLVARIIEAAKDLGRVRGLSIIVGFTILVTGLHVMQKNFTPQAKAYVLPAGASRPPRPAPKPQAARPELLTAAPAVTAITQATPVRKTGTARVSGHVYAPDGKGMAGLKITLSPAAYPAHVPKATAVTQADGSYALERNEAGAVLIGVMVDPVSPFCAPDPAYVMMSVDRDLEGVDFHLGEGNTIKGFVTNETSEPLARAVVTVNLLKISEQFVPPCQRFVIEGDERFRRKTVSTEPNGYFEIKGIDTDARVFSIEAKAERCLPHGFEPVQPFDEIQTISLKTAATVRLVVRDMASKGALGNFRYRFGSGWAWGVGWEHPFMKWTQPTPAEAAGEVMVQAVPAGEWQIEVEELGSDSLPTGRRAEVVHNVTGKNDVVHFSIGAFGSITGVVRDTAGKPVPSAEVRVYPYYAALKSEEEVENRITYIENTPFDGDLRPQTVLGATRTGPDGSFRFGGLYSGRFEVAAEKEDLVTGRRTWVDVPAGGEAQPVDIRLDTGAVLFGKVTGPDGKPMAGAVIRSEQGHYKGVPVARTDTKGYYVLRHVRPDRYMLGVEAHDESMAEIVVSAGQQRELNFNLSGPITVTGEITVNGMPWKQSAYMLYFREQEKGYPRMYEQDTGYRIRPDTPNSHTYHTKLPPGHYYIWAHYSDNRALMVQPVSIAADSSEQRLDIRIEQADVSVVVFDGKRQPVSHGVACFDQRQGPFVELRVFSKDLRQQQSYFSDLIRSEYKVTFVSYDGNLIGESDWVTIGPGQDNAIVIDAHETERGQAIGSWNPTNISAEFADRSFSASDVVNASGTYQATVFYDWGHHGVRIEQVSLLENGREAACDKHAGWSGTGKRSHIYKLSLPKFKQDAKYTVMVNMRSEGGTISQGTVYLNKVE